jgi:hypothetical protein
MLHEEMKGSTAASLTLVVPRLNSSNGRLASPRCAADQQWLSFGFIPPTRVFEFEMRDFPQNLVQMVGEPTTHTHEMKAILDKQISLPKCKFETL